MSFLIVDDNRHMRRTLHRMLNTAFPGKDVFEAADGEAARAACATHSPRVVLMDVGLPDTNGIDQIGAIKIIQPMACVIVVSSYTNSIHRDRALLAGAFTFIPKDEVVQQLLPVLRTVLGTKAGPKV